MVVLGVPQRIRKGLAAEAELGGGGEAELRGVLGGKDDASRGGLIAVDAAGGWTWSEEGTDVALDDE